MNEDKPEAEIAQENADFAGGFESERPAPKPEKAADKPQTEVKPEPAETPREPAAPKPEFVRVTKQEWAEVRAAAAKTASYDAQLSKLFGTTGNLQKLVQGAQAQAPAGRKIEIPKDAFSAMEKDFPELAQQTRTAIERALSGVTGTGANDVDPDKLEGMLASFAAKREIEALEDAYPDWREIVGAVDVSRGVQPDPNQPFRKWLAGKDATYQARVNNSESAAVIGRAIKLFQRETTVAAQPRVNGTPRNDARADRIRAAVQPRGDAGGASAAGSSDDDQFEAGFRSARG